MLWQWLNGCGCLSVELLGGGAKGEFDVDILSGDLMLVPVMEERRGDDVDPVHSLLQKLCFSSSSIMGY